ncbi:MAG: AMP-binding enzyme, partial [Planctomycetaceae bacterium]
AAQGARVAVMDIDADRAAQVAAQVGGVAVGVDVSSETGVAEAAVVGFPHEIKGEGICCFVTLKTGDGDDDLKKELVQHVRSSIGALATPDQVRFATALPKTRSGKIMRRLLRDIAAGRESTQDTTTLEDLSILAKLREDDE